jgi:hypothetical protein
MKLHCLMFHLADKCGCGRYPNTTCSGCYRNTIFHKHLILILFIVDLQLITTCEVILEFFLVMIVIAYLFIVFIVVCRLLLLLLKISAQFYVIWVYNKAQVVVIVPLEILTLQMVLMMV